MHYWFLIKTIIIIIIIIIIKSYLENRTQICFVSGSLSKTCSLQCGIPQETILGPLLILLYIKDLLYRLTDSYRRMYVDDTHLTYADKDVNIIQSCTV